MSVSSKSGVALALVAATALAVPNTASARSRDIWKYGAIGLGAAAIYNMGQRSAYRPAYYPSYYYTPRYYAPRYYAPVYPVYGGYYGGCRSYY
jgi:hypothetical protein